MRLNLTTTHDILVSFVQAPSECPKAKKARADRDFHSPLIPPLNVSPELDPHKEAQLDLTTGTAAWLQEDFVQLRKRLELKSLEPVRKQNSSLLV